MFEGKQFLPFVMVSTRKQEASTGFAPRRCDFARELTQEAVDSFSSVAGQISTAEPTHCRLQKENSRLLTEDPHLDRLHKQNYRMCGVCGKGDLRFCGVGVSSTCLGLVQRKNPNFWSLKIGSLGSGSIFPALMSSHCVRAARATSDVA